MTDTFTITGRRADSMRVPEGHQIVRSTTLSRNAEQGHNLATRPTPGPTQTHLPSISSHSRGGDASSPNVASADDTERAHYSHFIAVQPPRFIQVPATVQLISAIGRLNIST
jgi:hypothetical protein